jgi:hypothetical protein
VSRVRVLHPEFGYVGTSRFCRTFVAFLVCGFIAGAISFGIFNRQHDRDPLDAMALAPAETLRPPKAPSAQKIDEEGTKATSRAGSIKPTCRESVGAVPEGDCTPVRALRVRPLRAVNERPLIAAVPIGQRDDPRVLAATTNPSCSRSYAYHSARRAESHPYPNGDICCRGDAC